MCFACKNAVVLLFVHCINILATRYAMSQTCGYVAPKLEDVQRVYLGTGHHSIRKRSAADAGLKMHIHFDSNLDRLLQQYPESKDLIKKDLLPHAVRFFKDALSVRNRTKNIKLYHTCKGNFTWTLTSLSTQPYCHYEEGCEDNPKCGNAIIPPEHLKPCQTYNNGTRKIRLTGGGPGVSNTDYILYVTAANTSSCMGNATAHALHCQLDLLTDRPVAGVINLCPSHIVEKRTSSLEMLRGIVQHEILHALGFTNALFAFFRDDNGKPITKRDKKRNLPKDFDGSYYKWSHKTAKEFVRSDWKVRNNKIERKVYMVVSPRVRKEARRYFKCDSLEGAELEDQGGPGTRYTHWEKRIFFNEVMTGSTNIHPRLSRITLAFMEDTGWYTANYSMADDITVRENIGCDFVKKSCMDWMQSHPDPAPFCNDIDARLTCDEKRTSKLHCNMVKYKKPLDKIYQHFNQLSNVSDSDLDKYGGSNPLGDYCPLLEAYESYYEVGGQHYFSVCNLMGYPIPIEKNYHLELYSRNSKCFRQIDNFILLRCGQTRQAKRWGSGCYNYRCQKDVGLVFILESMEFPCYDEDSVPIVKSNSHYTHLGKLECPPCAEVCPSSDCPSTPVTPPSNRTRYVINSPCNVTTLLPRTSAYSRLLLSFEGLSA